MADRKHKGYEPNGSEQRFASGTSVSLPDLSNHDVGAYCVCVPIVGHMAMLLAWAYNTLMVTRFVVLACNKS